MKLKTTTENGDKVIVRTILKSLDITIEDIIPLSKEISIDISTPHKVISLNDANLLVEHILASRQKLAFNIAEWKSNSTLDEYQNLIEFIDKVLTSIDKQIAQKSNLLENSNDVYNELQQMQVEDENLLTIKSYLLAKFDFSLEDLKDKLIFMKSQALEYLDKVESSLSIFDDRELSAQKINFNFTATKIVRLYEIQMQKLNNFSDIDKFFTTILQQFKIVQKKQEKFVSTDKDKLDTLLEESYLSEYNEIIYDEWKLEIDKINRLYIQFVKGYFIGQISQNSIIELFNILDTIKDELEDFYLTIRSGIVIKYKDNPKSKLLQEIVVKDRVFKIYQNSQTKFIKLLKTEKSKVAYRFLNNILSILLDFKIIEQSKDYEDIYKKMVDLHSTNLEIYINDIELYGKELEKRDLEISKLMFKMQTDLQKIEK